MAHMVSIHGTVGTDTYKYSAYGIIENDKCIQVRVIEDGSCISWALDNDQIESWKRNLEKVGKQ